MDDDDIRNAAVRRVVTLVALLNLAYFGIEFSVALNIKSVSLFADSVDFLEDASVNLLILLGLAWSARKRSEGCEPASLATANFRTRQPGSQLIGNFGRLVSTSWTPLSRR